MKKDQNPVLVPQDRICWLDALRVVSIFAVIVIHQAATGYSEAAPGSDGWRICLIFNSMTRFAVPSFVMISGAIYLGPERKITRAHILKRIGKLMTVFLFWSALYAVAETAKEQEPFLLIPVLRRIITGHYHMWYLYLITALYLVTPLLRTLAMKRNLLRAVMLAMFALGCAVELLPAGALQQEIAGNFSAIFTYTGYYCLGHSLYSKKHPTKRIGMLFLLSSALLAAVTASGDPKAIFSEKMPHVILYSAGVFLLFKNAAQRLEKMPRIQAAIRKITPCVFGMYLVHPAFNFVFRKVGLYALTGDPLVFVPLCSAVVWAASFVVILCMRKISLFRRIT